MNQNQRLFLIFLTIAFCSACYFSIVETEAEQEACNKIIDLFKVRFFI